MLFCAGAARSADTASANGSLYLNPWGPKNPQNNPVSGFAHWVFDKYNPPTERPPKTPWFIDTGRGAWGVNVPADIQGQGGYDAAWASFKGDRQLDANQSFSTSVLFTPPGPYISNTETPTEGVDFFAQSPTVASRYDNFGHQVLGIYLGPTVSGYSFYLAIHNTLSDENPDKFLTLSLSLTGTAKHPQEVKIVYTQLAQGNWSIKLESAGQSSLVFTSQEYGATWNTTTGLDGVRYFTSQGGTKPGGPLEWTTMSVR